MDIKINKNLYKKYNSFFGLRIKNKYNLDNFLKKLQIILNEKKNLENLSQYHIKILNYVKKDLFKSGTRERPKFVLTPNVVKEIETLNFGDIARYLVHRYRYEIYPQLKISDDYPPYLQIEPTSICNYRCVFF